MAHSGSMTMPPLVGTVHGDYELAVDPPTAIEGGCGCGASGGHASAPQHAPQYANAAQQQQQPPGHYEMRSVTAAPAGPRGYTPLPGGMPP